MRTETPKASRTDGAGISARLSATAHPEEPAQAGVSKEGPERTTSDGDLKHLSPGLI